MFSVGIIHVFDMNGMFLPVLIGLKADLREVVKATTTWDQPIPRNKSLVNFRKLEKFSYKILICQRIKLFNKCCQKMEQGCMLSRYS